MSKKEELLKLIEEKINKSFREGLFHGFLIGLFTCYLVVVLVKVIML